MSACQEKGEGRTSGWLEGLQHPLQHHGGADFAVGGFGYDKAGGRLNDIIGHNHASAHRQAVHEEGVVGDCHVGGIDGPAHCGQL